MERQIVCRLGYESCAAVALWLGLAMMTLLTGTVIFLFTDSALPARFLPSERPVVPVPVQARVH